MNLAGIIENHAVNRPNDAAIIESMRSIDYRTLWQMVESFAVRLIAAGIGPGDRVGLCLRDHAEHLAMHFAVPRVGATILPMDHRWTQVEKSMVAESFHARLVIREIDEDRVSGIVNLALEADWLQTGQFSLPELPETDDQPLLVSLSSGTTGRPKGAIVSHRQMYERFVNQWVTLGIGEADRFISVTPLYFGAARSFCMSMLVAGATVILDPPPHKPAALAAAIRDSGATVTFVVPTLMHRLLSVAENEGLLFPDLRLLVFGGSIVHADEAVEMRAKLTPHLSSYYATSEGGGISVLQPDEFDRHGDTVGRPTFRVDIDVVDDSGYSLKRGEVGRLRYRGPGVATAFLDEDGALDQTSSAGWFYPGDLAVIDTAGFIKLRGREKDMIIRGGVNVYPAEIERVLCKHDDVGEATVVGWPSPVMGEDIAAFITARKIIQTREIIDYCKKNLAPYKVPREIFIIDQMPKTNFGKIRKAELIDRLPPWLPRL